MDTEKGVIVPGFYYHYKHNDNGSINNYAYEVMGVARHSEDKTSLVMYRPLYENTYLGPALCSVRPLDIFIKPEILDGILLPRFKLISDGELIKELQKIKTQMYG